jgi:hypothetical protein
MKAHESKIAFICFHYFSELRVFNALLAIQIGKIFPAPRAHRHVQNAHLTDRLEVGPPPRIAG